MPPCGMAMPATLYPATTGVTDTLSAAAQRMTAITSSRVPGVTVTSAVPGGCSVMSSSQSAGSWTWSAPTSSSSFARMRRRPTAASRGSVLISRTRPPVASCSSGSMSPSTITSASGLMPFSTETSPRPMRSVAAVRPARMPSGTETGRRSTASRRPALAR